MARLVRVAPTTITRRLAVLVVSLAAAALAGCEEPNPGFCGPGGAACPVDGRPLDGRTIDATTGCASAPVCRQGQSCFEDTCVDCLDNDETQSPACTNPERPICAADRSCRACTTTPECDAALECVSGRCVTTAASPSGR
jgi:hypothetical protein